MKSVSVISVIPEKVYALADLFHQSNHSSKRYYLLFSNIFWGFTSNDCQRKLGFPACIQTEGEIGYPLLPSSLSKFLNRTESSRIRKQPNQCDNTFIARRPRLRMKLRKCAWRFSDRANICVIVKWTHASPLCTALLSDEWAGHSRRAILPAFSHNLNLNV